MVIAGITGWLESLVTNLVCFIETAAIRVFNLIIAAIGSLIEALAAVLPDMPDMPDRPAAFDTALGWINWIIPVGTVVTIAGFVLAAWLVWQAVAIALRWAKALNA
jgi:hypothetical protein